MKCKTPMSHVQCKPSKHPNKRGRSRPCEVLHKATNSLEKYLNEVSSPSQVTSWWCPLPFSPCKKLEDPHCSDGFKSVQIICFCLLCFFQVFLWFLLFNVRCQVDAVEFLNLFHALTVASFHVFFPYPYALNSKRQKCRLAGYVFCPFQQHTVNQCKLHI